MKRAAVPFVLASLACTPVVARAESADLPNVETALTQASPAIEKPDLVGFDAFSRLLDWVGKLPSAFETFVSSEKRDQLSRTMKTLAGAFGKVNEDCVSLSRLVERNETRDEQLRKSFDTLLKSIVGLRQAVLALAADLGEHTGQGGNSLAFELATVTMNRADVTEEARRQVLGGDRVEAVKKLRQASALAEQAQQLVLGFLPMLR